MVKSNKDPAHGFVFPTHPYSLNLVDRCSMLLLNR